MKVVWAELALKNLQNILDYWIDRTQSLSFANYLLKRIDTNILTIKKFPNIGKQYKKGPIRQIIIGDFSIFYTSNNKNIQILLIWDNRQNPNKLNEILQKN
jgi:plasmid stabilization system protein ParE